MAGTPGATVRAGVPSAPGERGRPGWWFPAEAARSREPGRQGRSPDPGSPVCCEWGTEEFSKTHRVGAGVLQVSAPRLSCLPGLPRSCSNAQIHGSGQLVPAEAAEQGLSRCLFPVGSFPCETRPRSVADATLAWPTPARPPGDCGGPSLVAQTERRPGGLGPRCPVRFIIAHCHTGHHSSSDRRL